MPTWGELLFELQPKKDSEGNNIPGLTLDELRAKYLKMLSDKTGRNIIAYYSGWLKQGRNQNVDINDSDITGFMNAIHGLDCSKGVDIILHTPGGNPTATEGIVKYLHDKFGKDVRVIVPQMAMSAGTMLACASKEILMGSHSCLGPIDPQYGGIPAYNIIKEFQEAKKELMNNPESKEYWRIQFEKYPAAFFYSVCDAIKLSEILVVEWLKQYMFYDMDTQTVNKKVKKIVAKLNSNNKSHSRHFTYDSCLEMGLNVLKIENDQDLQNLILSVHHAYIITLDASTATKIIENQNGQRFITTQSR